MEKKVKYLYYLFSVNLISVIFILILYLINIQIVIDALTSEEGAVEVLIIFLIRISILGCISLYMLKLWFSQEEMYISDLPFLFAMFFLFIMYGKFLDLLCNYMYVTIDSETYLIYIKIRQFFAVVALAPLVFLSIQMIIFFLQINEKIKKYTDNREKEAISLKILFSILMIEAVFIILITNTIIAGITIAIIIISPMIVSIWLFYFAYRNKRLSQVHPLIIAIGLTGYLISSIFRPLAQLIIGENLVFIIVVEVIDIIVFSIIFLGLIKKVNY
ncbi:MAG: hypothetical protein ACTSR8_14165 [Promethearchaeota archaeon]